MNYTNNWIQEEPHGNLYLNEHRGLEDFMKDS